MSWISKTLSRRSVERSYFSLILQTLSQPIMKITTLYPNANQRTEYFVLSHVVSENKCLVNLVSRLNSLLTFTTKCTLIDLAHGGTFEVLIILLFLFVPRDHGHLIFSCLYAFFLICCCFVEDWTNRKPRITRSPRNTGQ